MTPVTRSPLASHLPIPGVDRQRALISYRPIFGTDGPERRTRYCFGGWAAAVRSDLLIRPTPLARERPERAERFVQAMPHPPLAWFLPGPEHMRGAQRGGSLAVSSFTGEARRNPLGGTRPRKSHDIRALDNHAFGLLDSFAKSTTSSLPNSLGQIHLAKSSLSVTFKTAV